METTRTLTKKSISEDIICPTSGKWSSQEDLVDEQIEASQMLSKHLNIEDSPQYEEPDTSQEKVATVRGFWTDYNRKS